LRRLLLNPATRFAMLGEPELDYKSAVCLCQQRTGTLTAAQSRNYGCAHENFTACSTALQMLNAPGTIKKTVQNIDSAVCQ